MINHRAIRKLRDSGRMDDLATLVKMKDPAPCAGGWQTHRQGAHQGKCEKFVFLFLQKVRKVCFSLEAVR